MRSARIGPVPGAHRCEHRRARRPPVPSNPVGASPPFRRGCHPPPEHERESRPGRDSRRRAIARTNRNRSRRAPSEGRRRPDHGPSRSVPRDGRLPAGLRPRMGGGTPRAIARIEVRAIGSAMWLERCGCRRGPQRISGAGAGGVATRKVAGARVGRLLPSPIWSAGATRPARGTNVAAGRAADSYASGSSRP